MEAALPFGALFYPRHRERLALSCGMVAVTRSELITQCYKELGLDPEKNPQNLEFIFRYARDEGDIKAVQYMGLLMAQYIDAQE